MDFRFTALLALALISFLVFVVGLSVEYRNAVNYKQIPTWAIICGIFGAAVFVIAAALDILTSNGLVKF